MSWVITIVGTSYSRVLDTKELETRLKDGTPTNYDHVKVSMLCFWLEQTRSMHVATQSFRAQSNNLLNSS